MRMFHSLNDVPWERIGDFVGGRGFEKKAISDPGLTPAFSAEIVRLAPSGGSGEHMEPYSHLLYFVEGEGEVIVEGELHKVGPGSIAQIRAGTFHSIQNSSAGRMTIIAICDPPRIPRENEVTGTRMD